MRSPSPLPDPLAAATSFSVSDAPALGVTRGRLGRTGLEQPFHGVRSAVPLATVEDRCRAYLHRIRPGQCFSHTTAAVLHGLPLPRSIRNDPLLHVSVLAPQQPPRTRGVVGHRLIGRPGVATRLGPYPVVTAVEAWCQLAGVLDVPALVVAGDALVAHGVPDPDTVIAAMRVTADAVRRTGGERLRAALELVRPGVRSPMESLLRVVLVQAGLPAPEINVAIFTSRGRFLGEGDIVYRDARLILEYEGDGHRTDARQFRKDIGRREAFEDAGWGVLRVTAEDLFPARARLIARVRRRLASPGPQRTNARSEGLGARVRAE